MTRLQNGTLLRRRMGARKSRMKTVYVCTACLLHGVQHARTVVLPGACGPVARKPCTSRGEDKRVSTATEIALFELVHACIFARACYDGSRRGEARAFVLPSSTAGVGVGVA